MPRDQSSSRRGFLGYLLTGWVALFSIPVIKGILDFLSPAGSAVVASQDRRAFAIKASQLQFNAAKVLRLHNTPVMIVRTSTGQFKAFSARCTHLGCIVQFKGESDPPHFDCNCHGSRFDANGVNIAGPAARPLDRLRVETEGDDIYVVKT